MTSEYYPPFPYPAIDRIYNQEALYMLGCTTENIVDLIVTSPPYANNRRRAYGAPKPDEYVKWFMPIAAELKRVLKPSGSFILNIKECVINGERHTYVLELIMAMRAAGWRWNEEYVWHKRSAFPGKWPGRFRDAWERCLHFTLEKKFYMDQDSVRVPLGDWAKKRLKKPTDNDHKRFETTTGSRFGAKRSAWVGRELVFPTNVLHMNSEYTNKKHSAAYPVEIPSWFIKLFCPPGGLVLDPFMGSGTTAVAAQDLGRHYLGFEKEKAYCEVAEQRLAKEKGPELLAPGPDVIEASLTNA